MNDINKRIFFLMK